MAVDDFKRNHISDSFPINMNKESENQRWLYFKLVAIFILFLFTAVAVAAATASSSSALSRIEFAKNVGGENGIIFAWLAWNISP